MDTIDKINYYLVKQGKTGADLSRALGLSNSIYSQWNKKKTNPKRSKLSVIAEYLGVAVEDILPDDEEVLPKAKKERPTDGEALISELPEDIQKLIRICESNPDLAAALLSVAQQIEKGQIAGE